MTTSERDTFRIVGPDIDLETEVIVDSKGRRVDSAYIDRAIAEVDEALNR